MMEDLDRQFFRLNRVRIGEIDNTLLMHPATTDKCIVAIVAIFKIHSLSEMSQETARAIVEVLKNPKIPVRKASGSHRARYTSHFMLRWWKPRSKTRGRLL